LAGETFITGLWKASLIAAFCGIYRLDSKQSQLMGPTNQPKAAKLSIGHQLLHDADDSLLCSTQLSLMWGSLL